VILLILVGEASLRRALTDTRELDNKLINPDPETLAPTGIVKNRHRLGGLLSFYCRRAG